MPDSGAGTPATTTSSFQPIIGPYCHIAILLILLIVEPEHMQQQQQHRVATNHIGPYCLVSHSRCLFFRPTTYNNFQKNLDDFNQCQNQTKEPD